MLAQINVPLKQRMKMWDYPTIGSSIKQADVFGGHTIKSFPGLFVCVAYFYTGVAFYYSRLFLWKVSKVFTG